MNINLVTQYPPSTARVGNGAENKAGAGDRPGAGDGPGTGGKPGVDNRLGASDRTGPGDRPGAGDKAGAGDGTPAAVGTPVARDSKANAAYERPTGKTNAAVNATLRVELKIHEGTGRIVGRVVDTSTHKVVRELPPETLLRYLEKTRELFDDLTANDLGRAIDKRV